MRLTITLNMDNAAFADAAYPGDEAARILHDLASQLRGCSPEAGESIILRDENGNKVGTVEVSE